MIAFHPRLVSRGTGRAAAIPNGGIGKRRGATKNGVADDDVGLRAKGITAAAQDAADSWGVAVTARGAGTDE